MARKRTSAVDRGPSSRRSTNARNTSGPGIRTSDTRIPVTFGNGIVDRFLSGRLSSSQYNTLRFGGRARGGLSVSGS